MTSYIYQFVDEEIKEFIGHDLSPFNYVCTIDVDDANYALDTLGYIYPDIKVSNNKYITYMHNCLSSVSGYNKDAFTNIIIYVDVPYIFQKDQFDVYEVEVDPHDHSYGFYWKLKSRSSTNIGLRSISLVNAPTVCPVCFEPLKDNDIFDLYVEDNVKRCTNSMCWAHVYTAIRRYLIISCKRHNLFGFIYPYISAGIIHKPSDLYKLDIYDTLFVDEPIDKYLEQLAETRGNILLSDYLMSLSTVDYDLKEFKINPKNINYDFKPDNFVHYICTLADDYVRHIESFDKEHFNYGYQIWKDKHGVDISMYMTIPAFFEYAKYFYKSDSNIIALHELDDLSVFKSFGSYFNP